MKKKILFIIWSFSYGGGAEKILSNIVNNLDTNKYDITILEYYFAGIKEEKINKNIKLLPPIFDGTNKSIFNKIRRVFYEKILFYFAPFFIRRKKTKEKYDVEISFNYLIPTFMLDKNCPKKICWFHGSIEDLKKNKINREYERKILKDVDSIIAISKKTYNSIVDIYPEYENKTNIIYNGFQFNQIRDLSFHNIISDNINTDLIFCGRFDEGKNPLRMLEIAYLLKKYRKDFKLGFLGKGDLLNEMKRKIKEYELSDNIVVFGYQNNPYPFIKNSKIMCMTSLSEGFPTVIIEAMTLGKPFISTPVAGIEEMSNNQLCGFSVQNNEDFIYKILLLLENEEIYNKMSEECIKNVQKYSMDNQICALENLINNE